MAGRPRMRAKKLTAELDLMRAAQGYPGSLPALWDATPNTQRLEHVLKETLTGAALIASCNPMQMPPFQLAIWNEIRKHTWSIALRFAEAESERAAIAETLIEGLRAEGKEKVK